MEHVPPDRTQLAAKTDLAAAQAAVEHLAGLGAHPHQGVIAQLLSVAVGGAGLLLALPDTSQTVESTSMIIGSAPGPPPAAHAPGGSPLRPDPAGGRGPR